MTGKSGESEWSMKGLSPSTSILRPGKERYFSLKDARYKDITVRQMLSHASGMPDALDYHWAETWLQQLRG